MESMDKEIVRSYLHSAHKSIREVAINFGISYNEVHKILKANNVKMKRGNPHRAVAFPPVKEEFRYLTDKDIDFKKEIKTRFHS